MSIRALSYDADLAPWPRNVGANRITVRPTVSGKAAATAASEAGAVRGVEHRVHARDTRRDHVGLGDAEGLGVDGDVVPGR